MRLRQVAKGAKDSLTEVIRSGDLIAYTAEEGVRWLGEARLIWLAHPRGNAAPRIQQAVRMLSAHAEAAHCTRRASCS